MQQDIKDQILIVKKQLAQMKESKGYEAAFFIDILHLEEEVLELIRVISEAEDPANLEYKYLDNLQ